MIGFKPWAATARAPSAPVGRIPILPCFVQGGANSVGRRANSIGLRTSGARFDFDQFA